jgi:hypothetical protein
VYIKLNITIRGYEYLNEQMRGISYPKLDCKNTCLEKESDTPTKY